jgi:hypothetical protein
MNDGTVRPQRCTKSSRLVSEKRRCKDMRPTGAKRSGNFTGSSSRIKEVFEDILSEVQIKALLIESHKPHPRICEQTTKSIGDISVACELIESFSVNGKLTGCFLSEVSCR